jgi:hypothetical protein
MKLLVTGGRDFVDSVRFNEAMRQLPFKPDMIIQGGARGADTLAKHWAKANGVHPVTVDALWGFHGKAAGSLRNCAMLWLQPDYCLAMPGGSGTANMKQKAAEAGLPVWAPYG